MLPLTDIQKAMLVPTNTQLQMPNALLKIMLTDLPMLDLWPHDRQLILRSMEAKMLNTPQHLTKMQPKNELMEPTVQNTE